MRDNVINQQEAIKQKRIKQALKIVADSGCPELGKGGRLLDKVYNVLDKEGRAEGSGAVFLCAEAALKQCDYYFLGLNPGGAEDAESPSGLIVESLASSRLGCSAFDQDWSDKCNYEPGFAPLQKRFKFIAAYLGIAYGAIPASNLVFTRSKRVNTHLGFDEERKLNETMHRMIIDEIKPKKLWIMGNMDKTGELLLLQDMEWKKSGYSNWSIGHGTGVFCGHEVEICHTPHLSFWDPHGKEHLLKFSFNI